MKAAHKRGFTLIELLVVIAIIAILAAILFPVFAKARERAQLTTCISNLKQFGIAFQSYASDYDSRYPSPGGAASYQSTWDIDSGGTIHAYIAHGARRAGDPALVWACPDYQSMFKKGGNFASRSYEMNGYLRAGQGMDVGYPGETSFEAGINTSDIKNPVQTILLFEGYYNNTRGDTKDTGYGYVFRNGEMKDALGYYDFPNGGDPAYASEKPFHGDRNAYLWCDGHVASKRPEVRSDPDFRNGVPPATKPDKNNWYARKYR